MTNHTPTPTSPMRSDSAYGMDFFGLDGDGSDIKWDAFKDALNVLVGLRGSLSVRTIAEIFNVTDDVVRKAADEAYWLFLTGPIDDPTQQMVEADGE